MEPEKIKVLAKVLEEALDDTYDYCFDYGPSYDYYEVVRHLLSIGFINKDFLKESKQ